MSAVIIGVDPHKLSSTIEVVDRRERLLGSGRFGTTTPGTRRCGPTRGADPAAGADREPACTGCRPSWFPVRRRRT